MRSIHKCYGATQGVAASATLVMTHNHWSNVLFLWVAYNSTRIAMSHGNDDVRNV